MRRIINCLLAALLIGFLSGPRPAKAAAFLAINGGTWSYSAAFASSPAGTAYFWGLSLWSWQRLLRLCRFLFPDWQGSRIRGCACGLWLARRLVRPGPCRSPGGYRVGHSRHISQPVDVDEWGELRPKSRERLRNRGDDR
jgi:hypothetical protein